jgi:hypothetical protein
MTSEQSATAARPGRRPALPALLSIVFIAALSPQSAPGENGLPASLHCAQAANRQLAAWDSRGEFLPAGNATVLRSPTSRIGVWVEVRMAADRVVAVSRIAADDETIVTLDASCQARIDSHPVPEQANSPDVFTDEDVAAIVDSNEAGVFYAWSPHMPLSVDGYAEIRAAAEALNIAVTPVLNGHANIGYAHDRARRVDMPAAGFARNRSVELNMRALNVHAPAILIYAHGRIVSPVIPGFRYAQDYEGLIGQFLESR